MEGVERLPAELGELATEVTVHFPWGSLLRGLLGAEPAVLVPIAYLLRPQAELRILLSATARDGHAELTPALFERNAADYAECGLELRSARVATPSEIAASRSTWAKRLGSGRAVVLARYSRCSSRRGRVSAGISLETHGIHSTANRPS